MTQKINLSDYTQPDFWADTVELNFDIQKEFTLVTNTTTYIKNSNTPHSRLILNGVNMELLDLKVNGQKREEVISAEQLTLEDLPQEFTLTSTVKIKPDQNLTGEGLYRSGKILCTQCEAEGFRSITLHQDRSDVMSSYSVRIEADKKLFPYLLSNGDLKDSGDLEQGRHFAIWQDPHKKPSYLFALVAGDLEKITDNFTTQSGRKVALEFFVDHGNGDKVDHAMRSLKNAMRWDEEKFGLEYDLDTYMIVAVDSFNMGAMENKGLNIFNSAYVLAKPETATDQDFYGIEGVIGHEYFHNWTGNRVTCRDWFQLTLKEGLTVFRDQEFSSDMNSRSVKRIEDVMVLKSHQFPEDASPLSHPIKPKSYIEINNFYTATVYEKGAEVIRMIQTLLGVEGFRKGMDLYFKRHDGQAVTTEDFVAAMADANQCDLAQFSLWYDQNGTPEVDIKTEYKNGQFKATISHTTKFNREAQSLHFPFAFSLYSEAGELMHEEKSFQITSNPQIVVVDNINSEPVPSWNEGFCAPVKINYEYSFEQLTMLMGHCRDEFNRYDAAAQCSLKQIKAVEEQLKKGESPVLSSAFETAYRELLTDKKSDPAFLGYALSIPSLKMVNDAREKYNFDQLPAAIEFIKETLAKKLNDELLTLVHELREVGEFKVDANAMGRRALKHQCLNLLAAQGHYEPIFEIFSSATNMTDEFGCLKLLATKDNEFRTKALDKFYQKWKHETLVMQKWLGAQASARDCSVEVMERLEQVDVYDKQVPNLLRSLVGVFINSNQLNLHQRDGSGYRYACKKILEVDKFNPQIAARLAKGLSVRTKLDAERKALLEAQLDKMLKEDLSKDLFEVVKTNLE